MTRPVALAALAFLASALLAPALAGEAPISLADPSGQGMHLEKLDLRLAAHGPLALTELDMVFRNPKSRVMEGKFVCRLPVGATI